MKTELISFLLVTVLISGCETIAKSRANQLNYPDYAGAPIRSFWMPQLDGWTVVDDKLLVVRTNFNKEYLLKLAGYCPDLKFAFTIGVTSSTGTVDRFEKVVVGKDQCMISEIRPIDSARMKADQKKLNAKLAENKQQKSE